MDLRVPSPRPAINIMPSGNMVSISPAAPPLSETKIEVVKKSGIPGTGPGTCMVCLEDCDDILGSAWLHQPRRVSQPDTAEEEDKHKKNLHDCAVAACVACLKTYFTGIVEAGFNGACPRMRCMCCPRVVCERTWAPLVEPDVLETFQKRAAMLLSIQCGLCHSRGTIMVKPQAGHCHSSALEKLMVEVDKALDSTSTAAPAATATAATTAATSATVASIDTGNGNGNGDDVMASSIRNAEIKEAFRAALARYTSGDDVDASPCYVAMERAFSKPEVSEMDQSIRDDLMQLLMTCVEDSERRANLHIRFIRSNPMVTTVCCKALHCYRCRVIGGHETMTCEQYEAQRAPEQLCKCPGCGVYVVKGDGCDSITCICGHNFCWSALVRDRNMRVADAFRDAHPEGTDRAAVQIIRRGPPAEAATADAQQAVSDMETAGVETILSASQEEEVHRDSEERPVRARGPGQGPDGGYVTIEPVLETDVPVESDGEWGPEPVQVREGGGGYQEVVSEVVPEPVQVEEPVRGMVPGGAHEQDRPNPGGADTGWVTETGEVDGWEGETLTRTVPAGNGPLLAEDEFRLASAYAEVYPREVAQARAAVYGEEHPNFTVQRARAQSNSEIWGTQGPALSTYSGQPRILAHGVSDAEATWQADSARAWLTHNRAAVSAVEGREAAARLSLVEAFYGDDTRLRHNTAIAHTAAEHARAALRVAAPLASTSASAAQQRHPSAQQRQRSEDQEPLFKWLGIVDLPPSAFTATGGTAESPQPGVGAGAGAGAGDGEEDEEEDEDVWVLPFADAEIDQEPRDVIPAPSALWTPWPTGRHAPARSIPSRRSRGRREARVPDPATRRVSALEAFGTVPVRRDVERWVAGSGARQVQLRRLMAAEEDQLSRAWVALWGRQLRLDPSTKTWIDANGDGNAAVRAAARRVIFLEAHPEQACQEQGAMMKAFGRRHGTAVANAVAESTAELATAWERMHAAAGPSTVTATTTATATDFDRAYAACVRHFETTAPDPASASTSDLGASSTTTSPPSSLTTAAAAAALPLRQTRRLAVAWWSTNHRRICARRFADRFAGAVDAAVVANGEKEARVGEGEKNNGKGKGREAEADATSNNDGSTTNAAAAAAAVVALVVAPMLLGRAPQMCDCELGDVIGGAVDWVCFNGDAFEREFEKMEGKIWRGGGGDGGTAGRVLEGCECWGGEGPSCSRFVACPVVARRYLRVSEPECTNCKEVDGFLDGDLFDLFS